MTATPPTPAVIAVFGPTGVGKTALAIALAERLRTHGDDPVAVSADALQVYRGLEVLTGVASPEEQRRLEHRLVSFVPVDARFSVAEHARLAHAEIDGLLAAHRTPIVVGGTGLYLRAALAELDLRPVAPDDAHRLVRLLELHEMGELPPPEDAPADGGERPNQLWTTQTRHPTRLIGVVRDREELYARIDARVDAMIAAGAVQEVRAADQAGASETARKALGFADLLTGDVEAMKRRTRNYARRQITWMRKLPDVELVDLTGRDAGDVAAELLPAAG